MEVNRKVCAAATAASVIVALLAAVMVVMNMQKPDATKKNTVNEKVVMPAVRPMSQNDSVIESYSVESETGSGSLEKAELLDSKIAVGDDSKDSSLRQMTSVSSDQGVRFDANAAVPKRVDSLTMIKSASGHPKSLIRRLDKMIIWYTRNSAEHLPESFLEGFGDLKFVPDLRTEFRLRRLLKTAASRHDWSVVQSVLEHCKAMPKMWTGHANSLFHVLLNAHWNGAGALMANVGLKPELLGGLAHELVEDSSNFGALVQKLTEYPDDEVYERSLSVIKPFGAVAKAVATKGSSVSSSQDLFDLLAVLAKPQLRQLWTVDGLAAGINQELVDPEFLVVKMLRKLSTPEEMKQYLQYVVQLCSARSKQFIGRSTMEKLVNSLPSDHWKMLSNLVFQVIEAI